MRQIALDTETTGLNPHKGDRIIEIAAIEISNRKVSQNVFHCLINPEREVPEEAVRIHGITTEHLQSKPLFAQIAPDFTAFIQDAELIIHNASFDVAFLDMELARLNQPPVSQIAAQITDTLKMARTQLPARSHSLDALCDFFKIDRTQRTQHGALIDTQLLAEVYLALTRGQESFHFDQNPNPSDNPNAATFQKAFGKSKIIYANDEELKAHQALLDQIEKKNKAPTLWQTL